MSTTGRMKTALLWKFDRQAEASPESIVSVIVGTADSIDGLADASEGDSVLTDSGNENGTDATSVRVKADDVAAVVRGDVIRVESLPWYVTSIRTDSAGAVMRLGLQRQRPHDDEADETGTDGGGFVW